MLRYLLTNRKPCAYVSQIVLSPLQAIALPSQTCAYKVKITETSCVAKASVITIKGTFIFFIFLWPRILLMFAKCVKFGRGSHCHRRECVAHVWLVCFLYRERMSGLFPLQWSHHDIQRAQSEAAIWRRLHSITRCQVRSPLSQIFFAFVRT